MAFGMVAIFFFIQFDIGEGCLVLNGQSQVFQDHNTAVRVGFRNGMHVLSRDLEFSCYGEVTGWAAYTERAGRFNTLTFQVWRPRGDQANVTGCSQTYDLVGSHTFNNVNTDSTKLLNISSVSAAEYGQQPPIPVQPGDVVGYYGNFNGGGRVSIQNDTSGNHLSYFTENVNSTRIDSTIEASSCSYFTESLAGAPVITATVVIQGSYIYKSHYNFKHTTSNNYCNDINLIQLVPMFH